MKRKISFVAAGIFALLGISLLIGQVIGMTGKVIGDFTEFNYGILVAEGLFVISLLLFQLNKKK